MRNKDVYENFGIVKRADEAIHGIVEWTTRGKLIQSEDKRTEFIRVASAADLSFRGRPFMPWEEMVAEVLTG